MDFSYVHIRYFIGYVYHICLQDTIQSTLSLCLLCQAMLLPMPLRPLLLTTRSGFTSVLNTSLNLNWWMTYLDFHCQGLLRGAFVRHFWNWKLMIGKHGSIGEI